MYNEDEDEILRLRGAIRDAKRELDADSHNPLEWSRMIERARQTLEDALRPALPHDAEKFDPSTLTDKMDINDWKAVCGALMTEVRELTAWQTSVNRQRIKDRRILMSLHDCDSVDDTPQPCRCVPAPGHHKYCSVCGTQQDPCTPILSEEIVDDQHA